MEKLKAFLASTLGRIVVTIVAAVVIYGVLLLVANNGNTTVALIVFVICTYFGWKALNFITPNVFLIMPVGRWITYYLIKGVVSFFIGCFVAPFQIGKLISDAVADSVQ